jgi:hypothetical protein
MHEQCGDLVATALRAVPISDTRTCSLPARERSRGDASDKEHMRSGIAWVDGNAARAAGARSPRRPSDQGKAAVDAFDMDGQTGGRKWAGAHESKRGKRTSFKIDGST